MIITRSPLDLVDLGIGQSEGERGVGLHASDIYNDLFKELEPKRYRNDDDAGPDPLVLEVGLNWESMLEEALRRRFGHNRPGEFCTPEGIYFNPDLLIYEPGSPVRVGEIKATWMSAKHGIEHPKFDKWLTQLKFYCRALGTNLGRLYVFFVCGDYTYRPFLKPMFPDPWDIEFSEQELHENYQMLLKHAHSKGWL